MEKFELNILGCGSALPTTRHFPTSQVLNIREKLFMIDCGEGAQLQMRRSKLKFNRLNHIFISHLHGDHCFGLPGLISTLGMLGRTASLHIHAHADLKALLVPQLDFFCKSLPYEVIFHPVNPNLSDLIYEDRSITVHSIPLKHRIPCCGFLFSEKPRPRHLLREMADFHHVPVCEYNRIKNGADYVTPEGKIVPNRLLTSPADPPRRYAYCSDTVYKEDIVPLIQGADLLFHEATFAECDQSHATEKFHSTARQAAEIARRAEVKLLMIGHFSARYENEELLLKEASEVFPQTLLAKENLCLNI